MKNSSITRQHFIADFRSMTGTTAEVYRSKLRKFCLSSTAKIIKLQTTNSIVMTVAAERTLTDRPSKNAFGH